MVYSDGDFDDLPELCPATPPPETKKKESSDSENDWEKWYQRSRYFFHCKNEKNLKQAAF